MADLFVGDLVRGALPDHVADRRCQRRAQGNQRRDIDLRHGNPLPAFRRAFPRSLYVHVLFDRSSTITVVRRRQGLDPQRARQRSPSDLRHGTGPGDAAICPVRRRNRNCYPAAGQFASAGEPADAGNGRYRQKVGARRPPSCLNTVGTVGSPEHPRPETVPLRAAGARDRTARKVGKGGDERMTADEPRGNDFSPAHAASGTASRSPALSSGPRPRPPTRWRAPPPSDPHQFGRVDDDGTVWLISSAGERIVGSWQAGDREAAFAHFGRRFDDLSHRGHAHGGAAGLGDR